MKRRKTKKNLKPFRTYILAAKAAALVAVLMTGIAADKAVEAYTSTHEVRVVDTVEWNKYAAWTQLEADIEASKKKLVTERAVSPAPSKKNKVSAIQPEPPHKPQVKS